MPIPATNFNYDEFHVFVMLYAANADGKITDTEEALMTAILNPEQYAAVKSIFRQMNDGDALECIFSYQDKYLATQSARDKVLSDMVRVYAADDNFNAIERGVHQLFERMMKRG